MHYPPSSTSSPPSSTSWIGEIASQTWWRFDWFAPGTGEMVLDSDVVVVSFSSLVCPGYCTSYYHGWSNYVWVYFLLFHDALYASDIALCEVRPSMHDSNVQTITKHIFAAVVEASQRELLPESTAKLPPAFLNGMHSSANPSRGSLSSIRAVHR